MVNRQLTFLETVGIAAIAFGTAYVAYKIGYLRGQNDQNRIHGFKGGLLYFGPTKEQG